MVARHLPSFAASLTLGLCCLWVPLGVAEDFADPPPPAGIGATTEALTVKGITYHHVKVRTVSKTGIIIQHGGGLSSLAWGDLPQSWRKALASSIPRDPTPAPTLPQKASATTATPAGQQLKINFQPTKQPDPAPLPSFFTKFGQPATPQASVDLRPEIRTLGLWIRQQGPQPSCSIFAILGAIEYQYARRTGVPVRFDAEDLIRKTEEVTKRRRFRSAEDANADAGFSLPEVGSAIRLQGLRVSEEYLQELLKKDPAAAAETPPVPRVALHLLPQGDKAQQVVDLVHSLDAGYPVPIGITFPSRRASENGYLSTQQPAPDGAHAVTLVGYECPSGSIEDLVFVFRNSWGVQWGAGGYGRATYAYLRDNLLYAAVLEVN